MRKICAASNKKHFYVNNCIFSIYLDIFQNIFIYCDISRNISRYFSIYIERWWKNSSSCLYYDKNTSYSVFFKGFVYRLMELIPIFWRYKWKYMCFAVFQWNCISVARVMYGSVSCSEELSSPGLWFDIHLHIVHVAQALGRQAVSILLIHANSPRLSSDLRILGSQLRHWLQLLFYLINIHHLHFYSPSVMLEWLFFRHSTTFTYN